MISSTMECGGGVAAAADAQSLISISLMKIHNSRTQRGGIKLHKNLLVSYVLRNARQVYIKEKYAEIYRMQQYEEVIAVCNEIQELNPLELDAAEDAAADAEEQTRAAAAAAAAAGCCGGGGGGTDDAPLFGSACHRGAAHGRSAVGGGGGCASSAEVDGCKDAEPSYYRSCCMEAPHAPHCEQFAAGGNTHCNKTTVLDLDTHVVTTVENGYLHQDCCCDAPPPAARKRKVDFGCCACDLELDELSDLSRKRAKREDCCFSGAAAADYTDTSNISNLISIFGSGFSGLLSRQSDLEQICSKQALASLGAWTRAIVAF